MYTGIIALFVEYSAEMDLPATKKAGALMIVKQPTTGDTFSTTTPGC